MDSEETKSDKEPKQNSTAAKNAIKHGILATTASTYDKLSPEAIYNMLANEFGDETPSRKILLELAAQSYIRLVRCTKGEVELLAECLNPRIVKDSFELNFTTVIEEGTPAKISAESWEKLSLIYERYEPRHSTRLLQILSILNATRTPR